MIFDPRQETTGRLQAAALLWNASSDLQGIAILGNLQLQAIGLILSRNVCFYPEDGSSKFLRNSDNHIQVYTEQQPHRIQLKCNNRTLVHKWQAQSILQAKYSYFFFSQIPKFQTRTNSFQAVPTFLSVFSTDTTVYLVPRLFNAAPSKTEIIQLWTWYLPHTNTQSYHRIRRTSNRRCFVRSYVSGKSPIGVRDAVRCAEKGLLH